MSSMRGNILDLLKKNIVWKKSSHPATWCAIIEGLECFLSMGDFPDEPLYTVICGDESLEIDDLPHGWNILSE